MAETEIPNGTSWATHQHVIMAINIKSDTNFEQTDDATPVFYGSTSPFTITKPSDSGQQITITGTNVKKYMANDNIKPGTPILLITRVRDITDKLDDFDKRYIVCSNAAFDANTIKATITNIENKTWMGLTELINVDMTNKMKIFDRRAKYNKRLDQLLTNARNSVDKLFSAPAVIEVPTSVKRTVVTPTPIAKKTVPRLTPPDFRGFNSADEFFNSRAYKTWVREYRNKHPDEETPVSQFKGEVTAYFKKNPSRIRGGSPNDDLTGLINIVTDTDHGFKKYVYFLLMQPFYFKLNALTPKLLTKIRSYKLTDDKTSLNSTFDEHILQPFVKFSYVEYIDTVTNRDELTNNLSGLIAHSKSTGTISNFASQIEKDTKNYKELTFSQSRTYYIHICRFIELIEKQIETTMAQYLPDNSTLPEHVTDFIEYALNKIHEHMQQVTPLFELLTPINNILIRDNTQTPPQKRLQVYIDDYVSSQNRTDVITYLKLTNTEPEELSDNKSWNQRYDIHLKQAYLAGESHYKFNAMILGYKTYPNSFYKITYGMDKKKKIAAVDGLDGIVTYKRAEVGQKEIDKINKYDNYYLFGNYENIFPLYNIKNGAKETNRENATHMTAIIEQICTHEKPVFLLGYGASGSGKTSSLIYFNKGKTPDEQNGIVIHLCKEIIAKLNAQNTQINSVNVVVKEFYMTTGMQTNDIVKYIFDTNLMKTKTIGDIDKLKHAYHVNMNKPVEEFTTMGQVLKQLVDVDRYVKATTNNPQSSRSHVLVFIQFCSDADGTNDIRNLIIGDFAGKENEFQCAEIDTIVAFLNTKIENPESKYPGYPFYSAQLMGGDGNYENDPTNEIQQQIGLDARKYISSPVATHMVYNFEQPFASGHFIKNDTIPNQEEYINSAMKYQLEHGFKITNNENIQNNVIYTELLKIDDSRYNLLLQPESSVADSPDLPHIHPGIVIIDEYAGEENGHIQLLKQFILEDLFEVQSCDFNKPRFSQLHPGKTLTKANILSSVLKSRTLGQSADVTDKMVSKELAENEKQMASIGRAGITFEFPPNSGKTSVKDYKFIDAIYSGIIQHAKPIDTHVTEPRDYDTFFVSTINNMIKYIDNPANRGIFKTTYTSPFLCSQVTDDVIKQLLKKILNDDKTMVDSTEYSIVVTNLDKIPYYADKFDNNKPKPIPIVKTFTIESLSAHIMKTRFDFLFPFFEIKGGAYCENQKKTACRHNYVNELKYIFASLRVENNDMHKYLAYINESRNIITETMVRLKHGKQVCENRLIEGKYINSSLDQIRAAIKYILNEKHANSDAVFHSPDFIDICLQSYCPSGINCFNTSSTDVAPKSLIDEIYNHIYLKPNVESNAETKTKFYTDLVISVFGVFNVSRLADNPPTVPYIDINHLKQIYYNKGSYYSDNYPISWALHELKLQIEKLPKEQIKRLPLFEYVLEEQLEKLPLIDTLTKLIDVAKDDYTVHTSAENILSIASSSISDNFMNMLKEIIEAIDIHNAASTIGTLEFLDQLAKFNSVNNLCYKNTEVDTTPYLDDSEYDAYVTNAAPIKPA